MAVVKAAENPGLPVLMDWQDMDLDVGVMLEDMGDMVQFEIEPVSPIRSIRGFEITNLILADLCVEPFKFVLFFVFFFFGRFSFIGGQAV